MYGATARKSFRSFTTTLRLFTASSIGRASVPRRTLTEGEQVIFEKLNARFQPSNLDVEDVSGGCGTFYAISITSVDFKGLPMVKQHKLVTEELKKEIAGFHGLQIKTKAE
ncbi:bola protein [Rhizoctonia solani]|nr:bola protein [Rhizoctonia solani]